jgi:phage/plasmid-like protein (TIGR03299 family)
VSHLIEKFTDRTAAFVSARRSAWHQLGEVTDGCLTAEQVMDKAYLGNWNVRKLRMTATEITPDGVSTLPVPDAFATARTHPKTGHLDYLATVGSDYTIVQNEQHCELLNLLVQRSGAHFETAGSLRGGREVFVTMKLPETLRIAGIDDIGLYIAALNSHDGRTKFRIIITPIRIVCANTQRMALQSAKMCYEVRHTSGATAKIAAEARNALGMVEDYVPAFEAQAEKLIGRELSTVEFKQVIREIWPTKPNPSVRTRNNQARRERELLRLFQTAGTNANIRGTAWAGLQAIGELLDHHTHRDPIVRANRALPINGDYAKKKQQAYELLVAA